MAAAGRRGRGERRDRVQALAASPGVFGDESEDAAKPLVLPEDEAGVSGKRVQEVQLYGFWGVFCVARRQAREASAGAESRVREGIMYAQASFWFGACIFPRCRYLQQQRCFKQRTN